MRRFVPIKSLAGLALVATLGCPTGPSTYDPAPSPPPSDAAAEAGHRVGSYQPWGTGLTPAGATGELQTNGGGGTLAAASNVKGGSSFVSFGTTPATAGNVRTSNASNIIAFRDVGGGSNIVALASDATNQIFIGSDAAFGNRTPYVYMSPTTSGYMLTGAGTETAHWDSSSVQIVGSNSLKVGNTPAATGAIRLEAQAWIRAKDSGGNTRDLIAIDAGDFVRIGHQASGAYITLDPATSAASFAYNGGTAFAYSSTSITTSKPMEGDGAASPYGKDGEAVVAGPGGGTTTLSSTEYSKHMIQICNALGGSSGTGGNIILPTPSSGHGYSKFVYCGCQTTACTFARAGGGNNFTLATGKLAVIWVANSGVYEVTAAF